MFKKNHRCNLLILNWSQEKNTLIWRIFLWNSWSIALLSKSRKMSKNKSNAPRIKSYCTIHTDTKYHKLVKVTTTNCSLVHKNRIYARDSQTIIHPLFCWFFYVENIVLLSFEQKVTFISQVLHQLVLIEIQQFPYDLVYPCDFLLGCECCLLIVQKTVFHIAWLVHHHHKRIDVGHHWDQSRR